MMQDNQRDIRELLSILLDNIHKVQNGLCQLSYWLAYDENYFNYEEYRRLINYINENRPSKFSSIAAYKSRNSMYYWERGQTAPRIKWLKKHIKRNKS